MKTTSEEKTVLSAFLRTAVADRSSPEDIALATKESYFLGAREVVRRRIENLAQELTKLDINLSPTKDYYASGAFLSIDKNSYAVIDVEKNENKDDFQDFYTVFIYQKSILTSKKHILVDALDALSSAQEIKEILQSV